MNCKYCEAELQENAKFCSNCGNPVEEPEASAMVEEPVATEEMAGPEIVEKKNPGKIALIVGAVVLVAAILIAVIVGGAGNNAGDAASEPATEAGSEVVEATVPADGNPDDVTCKGSYTVSDEEVIAAADTVVATMGDKELTMSQLQVYYWLEVVYFLQDYGNYISYLGLDLNQSLDTQICTLSDENITWQQFFLSAALDSWTSFQAMALEAEAIELEMDPNMRASLDEMIDGLDETAAEYGVADSEELIRTNFGAGATVESYVNFWEIYYEGYTYYNHAYEQIEVTPEDVEAYFAENEATYEENNITKDSYYVDVRHVLVLVEGGTTDEETGETTYSEDEWEACRVEGQKLLDEWLAGDATEESFAEMANTYSEDPGSNTTGGLYEDVYVGEMVPEFEAWCFDESREYGDYGLIRTDYGYHVMFFVDTTEDVWYTTAEEDLLYELGESLTPDAVAKHPAEIDYSSIMLSYLSLAG